MAADSSSPFQLLRTGAATLVVAVLVSALVWLVRRILSPLPPGTRRPLVASCGWHPLIGHMKLLTSPYHHELIREALEKDCAPYGLITLRAPFFFTFVTIVDGDIARHVLATFPRALQNSSTLYLFLRSLPHKASKLFAFITKISGNEPSTVALPTLDGERAKRGLPSLILVQAVPSFPAVSSTWRRKHVRAAFSLNNLRAHIHEMLALVRKLASQLDAIPRAKTVDIDLAASALGLLPKRAALCIRRLCTFTIIFTILFPVRLQLDTIGAVAFGGFSFNALDGGEPGATVLSNSGPIFTELMLRAPEFWRNWVPM